MCQAPGCGDRKVTDSGGFGDELERRRRRMGQRLGLLGRELEALADRLCTTEVDDEGEDLHLGTTETVVPEGGSRTPSSRCTSRRSVLSGSLSCWIYPTSVDTKLSLSAVASDSILAGPCGFDFLGFRLSPQGITVAEATWKRFYDRALRLYEHDRRGAWRLSRLGRTSVGGASGRPPCSAHAPCTPEGSKDLRPTHCESRTGQTPLPLA